MGKTQSIRFDSKTAIYCYLYTTVLFLAGSAYGITCLFNTSTETVPTENSINIQSVLHRWDSAHYLNVASKGYTYNNDANGENIAFFPVYPLIIRVCSTISRLSLSWSALLVAHASFIATLVIFSRYLRGRSLERQVQHWSLICMAIWPASFFWRFAYSEATFLMLTVLAMYLMHQKRSLLVISLTIGLASATRPVGVALLVPFVIHLLQRYPKRHEFLAAFWIYMPLGCWGLLAFMTYQQLEFGEPLAFAKTQQHWRVRPDVDVTQKLASFAAFEPIWAVYRSDSLSYWKRFEPHSIPLLSLAFWNPLFFIGAGSLTYFGHRQRWLTLEETSLATGLLLIPFLTRGFDNCMLSQGRFAAMAFPIYIACGHVAQRIPAWLRRATACFAMFLLFYFSARFAAGFRLY